MTIKAYTSQLKGWAVDRVIELYKLDKDAKRDVEQLKADALKLVEFAFCEEECERVIRENIEQSEYDQKVAEALAMKPASNAADKLKVVSSEAPSTETVQ